MIQVLSALSAVRILGDFSRATETIALDDVRSRAARARARGDDPLCAQGSADAIICTCPVRASTAGRPGGARTGQACALSREAIPLAASAALCAEQV